MMLSEWLEQNGMTKTAFGERIGVSPSTMTDLCRGTQWVSARVALAIERETGRQVTIADILRAHSAWIQARLMKPAPPAPIDSAPPLSPGRTA